VNPLKPTPRTDAAWAKTFEDDEDQCRAGNAASDMRDECATLERELATLTVERDQLRAEFEKIAVIAAQTQDRNVSLKIERKQLCHEAERTDAIYQRACELEHELRAELVTAKKILNEETNRAERAEAELATERARLDYLQEWGFDFLTRAAIDAALKEAAK